MEERTIVAQHTLKYIVENRLIPISSRVVITINTPFNQSRPEDNLPLRSEIIPRNAVAYNVGPPTRGIDPETGCIVDFVPVTFYAERKR